MHENDSLNNFSTSLIDKDGMSLCMSPLAFMFSGSNRKFHNPYTPAGLPLPMNISPIDIGMNTTSSYFGEMGMDFLGLDEESRDVSFFTLSGKSWDIDGVSSPGLTLTSEATKSVNAVESTENRNNLNGNANVPVTPIRYSYSGHRQRAQSQNDTQQQLNDTIVNNAPYFHDKLDGDTYLPDEDLSFSFSPSIFSPGIHQMNGTSYSENKRDPTIQSATTLDSTVHYNSIDKHSTNKISMTDTLPLSTSVKIENNQSMAESAQRQLQQQFQQHSQRLARDFNEPSLIQRSEVNGSSFHKSNSNSQLSSAFESVHMNSEGGYKDDSKLQPLLRPSSDSVVKPVGSLFQTHSGDIAALSMGPVPVRRKVKSKLPIRSDPNQSLNSLSPINNSVMSGSSFSMIRSASLTSLTSNDLEDAPHREGKSYPLPCKCKKSRCLKLYCDCFAILKYCGKLCSCRDCFNVSSKEFEIQRTAAIESIKEKNPLAFQTKISGAEGTVQHAAGCHCKQSHCLKKYCECFHGGAFCGTNCKCQNCKNFSNSKDLQDVRIRDTGGQSLPGLALTALSNGLNGKNVHSRQQIDSSGNKNISNSAKTFLYLPQQRPLPLSDIGMKATGPGSDPSHSRPAIDTVTVTLGAKNNQLYANLGTKKQKESPTTIAESLNDSLNSPESSIHTDSPLDTTNNSIPRENGVSAISNGAVVATSDSCTPELSVGALSLASAATDGEADAPGEMQVASMVLESGLVLPVRSIDIFDQDLANLNQNTGTVRFGGKIGPQGPFRERGVARLQQRKISSPLLLSSSNEILTNPSYDSLAAFNGFSQRNSFDYHNTSMMSLPNNSYMDMSMSSVAVKCSDGSTKKRKVSFAQTQTYPFFGPQLPETSKLVALMCLDFLDPVDLISLASVNSLVRC